MMINRSHTQLLVIFLVLCTLPQTLHASDANYEAGMKALAAKDYTTALHNLELAISSEPDSLRNASQYRQAIIASKDFDRSLHFFEKLIADHPGCANAHLNFGFAYVDKIPVAGSITQVILANNALNEFTKAATLRPSWIAYYTLGKSYLFWPKIFNRASVGVLNLQKAVDIQKKQPRLRIYVNAYIALGDGYWKMDDLNKAQVVWREGLKDFPNNDILKNRLSLQGDQLRDVIEAQFDPSKRVDTDLREIWVN